MNNLDQEIQLWEEKQYIQNMQRMYKTDKHYKDPRKEVFQDYRHHRKTRWYYKHENKYVKNWTKRISRRNLKLEIYNEVYYHPRPHDYKTYGWITW